MENIKILKISLVFFAFMFLMKNINDYDKKNDTKKISENKTKTIEKFTALKLKPWEVGFPEKYKGKDDRSFEFAADGTTTTKMIGSNEDYKQYDSTKWTTDKVKIFCENAIADVGTLYLDERYSSNDLPYNSNNYPNQYTFIPSETRKTKFGEQGENNVDLIPSKDYIPILLPVVGQKSASDTTLELKQPQTVLLSYKDKKITTMDTQHKCNFKGWESHQASLEYKRDCNKHEGYCSYLNCRGNAFCN